MKRACRAIVTLALLGAVSACNGFFYQPTQSLGSWPQRKFENVWLRTPDGATLHGWFFPTTAAPKGTFVQFHGNAGNVSWHYEALDWVVDHGYQLITFDYRGYGRSSGYPYPEALRQDALAAIRYAQALPRGSRHPDLVLYGQSLGGAVLLDALGQLADRRRVRLVVVEGTFHSYQEVAASALWRRP
ncbi:MAG TPA: alpha/beta fold hydrolase, partial [Polyangiaceae bacterium]